ncbi:MAG: hypothetical protein QG607_25, partial [Patescibacteria group bacterium]|nr:hypothetical protein [Patescibacteria group bacterium]
RSDYRDCLRALLRRYPVSTLLTRNQWNLLNDHLSVNEEVSSLASDVRFTACVVQKHCTPPWASFAILPRSGKNVNLA